MDNRNQENIAQYKLWKRKLRLIRGIFAAFLISLLLLIFKDDFSQRWRRAMDRIEARTSPMVEIPDVESAPDVVDGIHTETGMVYGPGFDIVRSACLSCHSSKLIIQNRATRDGWKTMIRWMQETQGLPELGNQEPVILDYLAMYYAPRKTGRRPNLLIDDIAWYVLDLE